MFSWQPVKWVQYAVVGVGLPWVAGSWLSTDSLVGDISHRSALVAGDWAKLKVEGRDVTITGTAPSPDAAKQAADAVSKTFGVRTVDVAQIQVAPLASPAAEPVTADSTATPEIKGTWPEGIAKTLDVTVNGKTYSLGKDPELTSSSGNWVLKFAAPLPPGHYDITASVGDGSRTAALDKPVQLTVNEPPPPPAPPPKPVVAATINPVNSEPVTLSGTWPVGTGSKLSVTVNGKTVELGKDFALLSDADGKWRLKPGDDLPAGHYDVTVTVTPGDGSAPLETKGGFDIAAPAVAQPVPAPVAAASAPAAPTVSTSSSTSDHPTVTGTWPEGNGNKLQVELDGITHELGKDADLTSDGNGNWTLTPAKPVVNGSYDIVAKVVTPDGQSSVADGKAAVAVAVVAPQTPPPPAPINCDEVLARVAAVFPVRFDFNQDQLGGVYPDALGQYAALMKDERCGDLKLQVAGHADYLGSESYNQGLSERRAKAVVDALVKAGIDAGRLSLIGYGKTRPLDPAHSDGARAKNRRVEFTVQK